MKMLNHEETNVIFLDSLKKEIMSQSSEAFILLLLKYMENWNLKTTREKENEAQKKLDTEQNFSIHKKIK